MKTIFISSFHPLISRNILSTRLISVLAEKNIKTVILVPQKKLDFFKKEYETNCPGAVFEGISASTTRREKFLQYLSLAAVKSNSLALQRSTEMTGRGAWLAAFFGGRQVFWFFVRLMSDIFIPAGTFTWVFGRYKTDLVFSTDAQNELDIRMRKDAKIRGVRAVAAIRSWDNLTTKGLLRILPEKLLVQNDIAKKEAIRLHGAKADAVEVIGIPHYDFYFTQLGGARSGAAKKIALFVPTGDRYIKNNTVDRDILKMLDEALDKSWQILIRLPPTDSVSYLDNMKTNERFVFDRPGKSFNVHKNAELNRDDDLRLIDELKESSFVISGPSTMAIDAVFFDKPVVLMAFDGLERRLYLESIKRYYDYDHWRPVIESGGVKLAKNPKEFFNMIKYCIEDPKRDEENRKKVSEKFCFKADGKATERLANSLLKMI